MIIKSKVSSSFDSESVKDVKVVSLIIRLNYCMYREKYEQATARVNGIFVLIFSTCYSKLKFLLNYYKFVSFGYLPRLPKKKSTIRLKQPNTCLAVLGRKYSGEGDLWSEKLKTYLGKFFYEFKIKVITHSAPPLLGSARREAAQLRFRRNLSGCNICETALNKHLCFKVRLCS